MDVLTLLVWESVGVMRPCGLRRATDRGPEYVFERCSLVCVSTCGQFGDYALG